MMPRFRLHLATLVFVLLYTGAMVKLYAVPRYEIRGREAAAYSEHGWPMIAVINDTQEFSYRPANLRGSGYHIVPVGLAVDAVVFALILMALTYSVEMIVRKAGRPAPRHRTLIHTLHAPPDSKRAHRPAANSARTPTNPVLAAPLSAHSQSDEHSKGNETSV